MLKKGELSGLPPLFTVKTRTVKLKTQNPKLKTQNRLLNADSSK